MRRFGADLPLPEELRRSLLDIGLGEPLDRDGEARTVDLESIRWPSLEPSTALRQRLLAIPAHRTARRPAFLSTWRGPGAAAAASYVLAAALTLALGDPVDLGRRATSELRAATGEHVLEPAARTGSSLHAGLSRQFDALRGRVAPGALFGQPLALPTDRVQTWFRGAVDSSADAFRGLADLFSLDALGAGLAPDEANRPVPGPNPRRTDKERTFA